MMPVIRINDATFGYLKEISTWMGTEKPSDTIDKLVQERMTSLDLMTKQDLKQNVENEPYDTLPQLDQMEFDKTPSLSFTRIFSASIGSTVIKKPNWSTLLIKVVAVVKEKGLSVQKLVDELQIRSKDAEYSEHGYTYYPELGLSIQGQSAPDAWKETSRLAEKYSISVVVKFGWRENSKAQHPSRKGVLRAGMTKKQ